MKAHLLLILVFATVLSANAQMDSLSAHCHFSNLYDGVLDLETPIDSGFVIGNNYRGHLAHMQYFDATLGVSGAGTINALAFATPSITDGGGSVTFAIWPDNSGQPDYASPLGTVNIDLGAIILDAVPTDPSETMLRFADDNIPYNNIITFTTPVPIPATGKFWAGFISPENFPLNAFGTGLSLEPNGTAGSQAGAINSNGIFEFCYQIPWGSVYSIMIYPIVDFGSAGINENIISSSVFPNPATTELTIQSSEEIVSVHLITFDGKNVATSNSANLSITSLETGMYLYTITTISGKVGKGSFIKN